ncbi:MAG: response regulator [Planctomycetes bacterium]|nr:response regulator [Planctomycetota bacterium]
MDQAAPLVPSILMVEDNLGDATLLTEYLAESRFACTIRHCRLLGEAIEVLGTDSFQVVLLDLILPDSKGLQTFNAVHGKAPAVPIVILTGFSDEELASQAVKLGAQDYLPKDGITGLQLARTIRYAMERKRAESVLQLAKESAEAANKAKDRFIASLSHELRTPLTPVLTQVQILERDARLPTDVREAMAMIRRNIELEARLIDDLLDTTRVASGKMELRPVVVDVHSLLRHSVEICRAEIDRKGLRLALALSAASPWICADPDRLQQVFWNLLNNAVKFTPSGGTITLSTENHAPGRVAVTVADTGAGIETDLLPRIFEPFEQGGRTVTRKFGGLGLGLAISRSIVNLHEGMLTADSTGEGNGARFRVELRTVAKSAQPPASDRLPHGVAHAPKRILLVEDHDNTAKVMTLLLSSFGHQVTHARTVADAIAIATADKPDLLISDIGLPDASGLDLMRRLRALYPQLTGIVISGYGAADDVRQSSEAGFSKHLTKPFNDRALQEAIERVSADSATKGAAVSS